MAQSELKFAAASAAQPITPELQMRIERFYYDEADLLDRRLFMEWTTLMANDVDYFMPIRQSRLPSEVDEDIRPRAEGGHFVETKSTLVERAKKLSVSYSWAEHPMSRQRHMITNVRIWRTDDEHIYDVESYFHFYKSKGDSLVEHLVGSRRDKLAESVNGYGFQVLSRTVILDQSLLLTSAINTFI